MPSTLAPVEQPSGFLGGSAFDFLSAPPVKAQEGQAEEDKDSSVYAPPDLFASMTQSPPEKPAFKLPEPTPLQPITTMNPSAGGGLFGGLNLL